MWLIQFVILLLVSSFVIERKGLLWIWNALLIYRSRVLGPKEKKKQQMEPSAYHFDRHFRSSFIWKQICDWTLPQPKTRIGPGCKLRYSGQVWTCPQTIDFWHSIHHWFHLTFLWHNIFWMLIIMPEFVPHEIVWFWKIIILHPQNVHHLITPEPLWMLQVCLSAVMLEVLPRCSLWAFISPSFWAFDYLLSSGWYLKGDF